MSSVPSKALAAEIMIVYWHKNRQIGRNSRLKIIENHFDVKLEITEKLELSPTIQAIRVSNLAGIFSYNQKRNRNKLTSSTAVSWERFTRWGVGIAHDQNVVNTVTARTEGILENTARTEDYLRVITRSLVGGTSIEIPLG